jgi:hypothetical protein
VSVKNGKYKQHRLTYSSTFRFLCRNCKDGEDLDHNTKKILCHSYSWCDVSVNLKLAEEMFDADKGFNEFVSRAGIFSRLGALGVKIGYVREP